MSEDALNPLEGDKRTFREETGEVDPTPLNANTDRPDEEIHSPIAEKVEATIVPLSVAERFAKSILLAHGINDRSWSVYRMSRGIVLSISSYTAIMWTTATRSVDLLVLMPSMSASLVEKWGDAENGGLRAHDAKWFTASNGELDLLIHDLGEAHDAFINVAASEVKSLAARADIFDAEILSTIKSLSGVDLPSPGYVNELDAIRKSRGLLPPSREERNATEASYPFGIVRRAVEAHGLTYSDHQLATFFSALQTKGFVILSGISGTGKSKLAQMFVRCLPDSFAVSRGIPPAPGADITLSVTETNRKHGYFTLPIRQIVAFPLPEVGQSRPIVVRFGNDSALGTLSHIEFNGGRNRIVRMYTSGAVRSAFRDLPVDDRLSLDISLGDDNQIETISIRRSDVNSIASAQLTSETTLIPNNLFLSVRPDWRDSRALLGYHNPLLGSYEWTDFLRFVLRAAENFRGPEAGRIAWFVILDEMNLAHVEYYFADLLSVLESGRDHDGWTREAIRIERPDPTDDQDDAEVPPATIHLPPNLYIIGTVNMDETTHAFSPKVLDRAFTIELSQVDFTRYPPRMATGGGALTGDERASLLRDFSRHGRFVGIDKAEIAEVLDDYPEIRMWLQNLNVQLARSRIQFGYRVFDEIAAFVDAYRSLLPESSLHEAFDLAVLMKVLPKFSGSAARLERPLLSVLAWCIDPARVPVDEVRKLAETVDNKDWGDRDLSALGPMPLQETADRVKRMLDTLAVDGFASFG